MEGIEREREREREREMEGEGEKFIQLTKAIITVVLID